MMVFEITSINIVICLEFVENENDQMFTQSRQLFYDFKSMYSTIQIYFIIFIDNNLIFNCLNSSKKAVTKKTKNED